MKKAAHPYAKYEKEPIWAAIESALADLEANDDLHLATAKSHVIGFLCKAVQDAGYERLELRAGDRSFLVEIKEQKQRASA